MNVTEVAGLIAYFGSAWPKWEPSDDTADVWAGELEDIDVKVGRAAAKELVNNSTFAPSIAEFREACRSEANRQRLIESFKPLPPVHDAVPPPPEIIAGMRQMLAQQKVPLHRRPDEPEREPVVLPKSRCPRCGQDTIPYVWTLEPKQVERPVGFDEAYSEETQ